MKSLELKMSNVKLQTAALEKVIGFDTATNNQREVAHIQLFTSLPFDYNLEDDATYQALKKLFKEEPKKGSDQIIAKWQELGPIDLPEWILSKKVSFDHTKALTEQGACHKQENGLGRWSQDTVLYEGQFKEITADGYGRTIYESG